MHRNDNHCRVCGYELSFSPWGEDGESPTWDICPCCGTEFGYEDCTRASARKKREKWISSGKKWFKEREKPTDWNYEEQSINIPADFS